METVTNIQMNRINLLVTKKCNLRCRMCDYRLTTHFLKEMDYDTIIDVIDQGKACGMKLLEISGGEPMVRKDIYDIIAHAHNQGIEVLMMTNGTLIGEKEAENLATAGLDGIVISMEGNEEIHNQVRGNGNFQKAVNAINNLKKYSNQIKLIKVGVTISKYNYDILYDFTKYLFEEIGINGISYNAFTKDMLLESSYEERSTEFDMDEESIQQLETVIEKIIAYTKEQEGEFPLESYMRKIPSYFRKESMVPIHGCTAPMTGCCIDASGQVHGCWGDIVIFGNIVEKKLVDIIQSSEYQQFCKNAREKKCSGCLSACFMNVHE